LKDKINILFICSDEHRADCIGAYGNKDIDTGNLDRLAEDGVLYKNAFCPYPICTPSRYSMLSGMYVHQHGGSTNHCTLRSDFATFPRMLKEIGYKTAAVGKMHFTPTYLDVGFDDMELAEQDGPGRYDDDYHRELKQKNVADVIDLVDQVKEFRKDAPAEYWESFGAMESNLSEELYSTSWIARKALDRLEKWDDGGNLLMVSFIKPHHPFDPCKPWSDMYDPDKLTLLPGFTESCLEQDKRKGYFDYNYLTEEKLRRVTAYYYATISQIDYYVGQMTELLKRRNLYDNTMIIYTSDHGDYVGFHHLLLKGNRLYDPLARVPLIIKYPGKGNSGAINDALFSNIDLAPTILEAAGIPKADTMCGISMNSSKGRDMVFAENSGWEYMARTKTRKLLYCKNKEESMLFDLARDPLEMKNVIDDPEYSEDKYKLLEGLVQWRFFDTPVPAYLNEEEKLCKSGIAKKRDMAEKEELKDYYKQKVYEWKMEKR